MSEATGPSTVVTSQKLRFTATCVFNTAVSNATDALYYDIQTPEWEPHLTTVRRLDPHTGMYDVVARIQSEPGKPVEVALHGRELAPEDRWIKKVYGARPEGSPRWQFNDDHGNVFAWRVTDKTLELRKVDSTKDGRPFTTYHPHKRHLMVGAISQQAYLEVDSSVLDSLDAIILSFLLVGRKRRAGTLI